MTARGSCARWITLLVLVIVARITPPAFAETAAVDVYVARAIAAYQEKRYEEALAECAEALAMDAENVHALFYSGLASTAVGRLDAAADALEKAHGLAPGDVGIRFQLGIVQYHREKFDRAKPLLEELHAAGESLDGLSTYLGVVRYRLGDADGALAAFESAEPVDLDLRQLAAFYKSLALLQLGLNDRAEEEATRALELDGSSALAAPTQRLRDEVAEARRRERRLRLQVAVGAFYDDNVAVTPEVSDDPTVQAIRSAQGDEESPGISTSLRAEYVLLRQASFEATGRYSFYSTTNTDLPEFDILDQVGGLGGVWRGMLASRPVEFGIDYAYENVLLGLDSFLERHSVAPYASVVENERNQTYLQLRFQTKDFEESTLVRPDDGRDGENWLAGWLHVTSLFEDRLFAKLGYQFDLDDTNGRNFEYLGHRVLAGLQGPLPLGQLWWSYDFSVHVRDYRHRSSTFPVDDPGSRERSDEEYNHLVWLSHPLPYGLTIALMGQHTDAQSNLDPFRFRRNVGTIEMIWTF